MFDLARRSSSSHSLGAYNPFREMEELERRFFGSPLGSFFGTQDLAEFKTDLTDEGDHYLLEADLPGFDKKDIRLDIDGDVLTIRAERHSRLEEKDRKDNAIRIERSYGSYSRRFDVSAVDAERITAKYDNGVLTLALPKREKSLPQPRRLEIE